MDELVADTFINHVTGLPYAYGGGVGTGDFRCLEEDFIVDETLSFSPSGVGEHVFLTVKKVGLNTDDVAQSLAKVASVKRRDVAYAGMKDRHAVTTQMFSVHLPGKESPNWTDVLSDNIQLMNETRHSKKLKKGVIKHNAFIITVKNCEYDEKRFLNKIEQMRLQGVPNYFMEQRFGRNGYNLTKAYGIFLNNERIKSKRLKGLLLSAVRSFLFNQVLAKRVVEGSWNSGLEGDAYILSGTKQYFVEDARSKDIVNRLEEQDIHPSGPLYGPGQSVTKGAASDLESDILKRYSVFCEGLLNENVLPARRALRVIPNKLRVRTNDNDTLQFSFELPTGSYATAVLRELLLLNNKALNGY